MYLKAYFYITQIEKNILNAMSCKLNKLYIISTRIDRTPAQFEVDYKCLWTAVAR